MVLHIEQGGKLGPIQRPLTLALICGARGEGEVFSRLPWSVVVEGQALFTVNPCSIMLAVTHPRFGAIIHGLFITFLGV